MMKKNKQRLLLIALIALIPISSVSAWSGYIGYASTGSGGGGDGGTPDPYPYDKSLGSEKNGNETIKYNCEYNYNVNVDHDITIDAYNSENKEIMKDSLKISSNNKTIAGTSIGFNVFETKKISWSISYRVTKQTVKNIPLYNCTYSCELEVIAPGIRQCKNTKKTCSNYNQKGVTSCSTVTDCNVIATYAGTTPVTSTPVVTNNKSKNEKCEKEAATKAISAANSAIAASYKLRLPNSNNKKSTSTTTIDGICKSDKCEFDKYKKGKKSDSITVKFLYEPKKTCINVKTSNVRYIQSSKDCTSNELEVQRDTNHWHYFLPLNLTSNDEFKIQLQPASGGNLVPEQCQYVLENYSKTYKELIVKKDNTDFVGDWSKKKKKGSDYKYTSKKGCRLTSKIKIPITQQFYNEAEKKNDKNQKVIYFNGFNFYYKPIDISNLKPFPNELATNSIWKKWDESKKKNPNLTESFIKNGELNITYYTDNLSSSNIYKFDTAKSKKYEADNNGEKYDPNTNWMVMNPNGTSSFIEESQGIVRRKVKKTSFYKLGCGPSNENKYLDKAKKVKNPKYIKGCESK